MKRIPVFLMMAFLAGQTHGASEIKGWNDKPSGPAGGASSAVKPEAVGDAAGTPVVAAGDPLAEHLINLRTAATLLSEVICNATVNRLRTITMSESVITNILFGSTPDPEAIDHLNSLTDHTRRLALEKALEARAGILETFTIHKNSPFSDDIAAICQKAYKGDDPIIQQHNREYYLMAFDTAEKSRRIEAQYRSLAHVMAHDDDPRVPTYLTATQEELGDCSRLKAANAYFKANAYFAANPQVTLVLKASEGTTLNLRQYNIPASLKKLSIVGDHITTIDKNFLSYCMELTHIDLSHLSKTITIGSYFLSHCAGLTYIDLSPFRNVNTIGDFFLSHCRGLSAIDLSPLSEITTISDGFLFCSELRTINLRPLSKVKKIMDAFLTNCPLDAATQEAVVAFKAEVAARAA